MFCFPFRFAQKGRAGWMTASSSFLGAFAPHTSCLSPLLVAATAREHIHMSEHHRMGHRSLSARHGALFADKAKDKENNITNTSKKTVLTSSSSNEETSTFGRSILRSKSANGLKVSSSKSFTVAPNDNKNPLPNSSNANKARRIIKQPFSIFDTKINDENRGYHDTTTLQRSQSQIAKDKDTNNTLSRSSTLGSSFNSSMFGSSLTFKSSLNQTRKIKSQLTIGAETDMADFFKKSKEQDQKQLGLINNSSTTDAYTNNSIQEVTFADETDDITSMKRLATERNSPLYQRTHKVSLHTLLSSSTDGDDIEETTFDYKDKDNNKMIMDLESLMMNDRIKNIIPTNKDDDLEIEIVSHNTNGKYNENDLPESLEGIYQPMNKDLLSNLWDQPTSLSLAAAQKFEDPLELKNTWNTAENTKNILDLDLSEMKEPEELLLEFSDDDEEGDEDKEGDRKLVDLMQFYEQKGQTRGL